MSLIFITGRFRSGTTMLWNLFRHLPDTIAYYEPLHDFLPHHVNYPINASPEHLHVKTYFDEYNQIKEVLDLHKIEFARKNLYLESNDQYEELRIYLEKIIDLSKNYSNIVLKFNRIDLRLPWIKKNFPNAKILHIFRDPRDQWFSSLKGLSNSSINFDFNNFSLLHWAWDLHKLFPFISDNFISHPYERFYYLWKLSYIFGLHYSDISVSYEDFISSNNKNIERILSYMEVRKHFSFENLKNYINNNQPRKWSNNIDIRWFEHYEETCERTLEKFDLNNKFGKQKIKEIHNENIHYRKAINEITINNWFVTSLERNKNNDDFFQFGRILSLSNNYKVYENQIFELRTSIRKLTLDYDRIFNELERVYKSKSWKITKPFRDLLLFIKNSILLAKPIQANFKSKLFSIFHNFRMLPLISSILDIIKKNNSGSWQKFRSLLLNGTYFSDNRNSCIKDINKDGFFNYDFLTNDPNSLSEPAKKIYYDLLDKTKEIRKDQSCG